MKNRDNSRAKRVGGLLAALIVLVVLLVDQALLNQVTSAIGPFGPVFLTLFLLLSQVLAPLPGAPGILLSLKLYGFDMATLMLMVSSVLSAMINFFLARRYGKPLVQRLLGPERMQTVDRLERADEVTLLLFSRLFGFAFFDLVSYAIGLTNISFGRYMLYTVLFSTPALGIQYVLFRDMDFQSPAALAFFIVSVVGTGAGIAWFFMRILKKKKQI
ncbi:MAG: VTT domain-containing protein [Magnetococcales bacterium]|nr:VTT domain-containing protein [Magnetococcales bacterium]